MAEEELRDSWDMVQGHNRCQFSVNMLVHKWKEGYRLEEFAKMQVSVGSRTRICDLSGATS